MNVMQPFVDALNAALKNYLRMDPFLEQNLQPLVGKIVALEFSEFKKPIYLCFQADTILLQLSDVGDVDATLQGSCFSLMKMGLSLQQKKKAAGFAGKLTMRGDVDVAQQVNDFLLQLELDWEGQLAKWIGDVPARHVANVWRSGYQYMQKSQQQVADNVTDYLQEELRLLPPQEAVEDFYADVSELRMAVDRLAARVQRFNRENQDD